MPHDITTITGRKRLKQRREPYWQSIRKGQAVGFRKTVDEREDIGTWIAKLTIERKRQYHALTPAPKDYNAAQKSAEAWFEKQFRGESVGESAYTLQNCLEDYIEHLVKDNRSLVSIKLTQGIFKKIPNRLKKKPVDELTIRQLQGWRDSFRIRTSDPEEDRKNRNTCNRKWSDLRAALNWCFQQNYVSTDTAWRKIAPFKKVQKGREIFFSNQELSSIMKQSKKIDADFYRLCKAGAITGFRVGELKAIRVQDFDRHDKSVKICGKTGFRNAYLSEPACELFEKSCEEKNPVEFIFDFRGNKWSQQHHAKLFKRINNLPEKSCFYCLRHFYASKALTTEGVAVEMVAKNMGTSVTMIEKFYGKFTAKQQKIVANRISIQL